MNSTGNDILVIGAGVTGLTTAVCLAERGLKVLVRARELPDRTHSTAAGAMWGSYLANHDKAPDWGRYTLAVLRDLAGAPDTGIRLVGGVEACRTESAPPPWISDLGYGDCRDTELPDGFVRGWRFTVPVGEMPVYLGYLRRRFERAGGRIVQRQVDSLAGQAAAVVVNCAGLGARELADDPAMVPVRGQVVVVANPGIRTFFGEHRPEAAADGPAPVADAPTYVVPHGDTVVLGGTAETGREDLEPDPDAARAIIERCVAVAPALRGAPVRDHRVGIRPARALVRLERDRVADRAVVHNYGHGGSGFSLSWGCAREAADIVAAILAE